MITYISYFMIGFGLYMIIGGLVFITVGSRIQYLK